MDEIKQTFFIFGCIEEPTSSGLQGKINNFGPQLQIRQLDGFGYFFYTTPFYVDMFESDDMVWFKLGNVHDGKKLCSTHDMVENGWISRDGVRVDEFRGNATLVGYLKEEPQFFFYRNLFSSSGLQYWKDGKNLIVSDNLRLVSYFLNNPSLDESVLAQHFIYRNIFGPKTYVKDVRSLLGGEMISCIRGEIKVELKRDLSKFTGSAHKKPVNQETVDWFFNQLKTVMGIYLNGNERCSATMLSGGVDSSTMQAAINSQLEVDFQFPTYSFLIDTPSFNFEKEYAKDAARKLNTHHTFVKIKPEEFGAWLIKSISILGQPVPFDAPPAFLALTESIQVNNPEIQFLFHGGNADELLGISRSIKVVQGDKYRNWPVPILKLLASILRPLSQSKSYGAREAAFTLEAYQEKYSPDNFHNFSTTCDWDLVKRSFSLAEIHRAVSVKHDLVNRYGSSDFLVEQLQMNEILTDGMNVPSLERQLGLASEREFVFPFGDDAIVETVFSFEPLERYTFGHRTKPLLKLALESQGSLGVINKPKGYSSIFNQDVIPWMRDGSLCELVREIDRPPFMSSEDFQSVIEEPDWYTWNLLTLDLFEKYGLPKS
jgi:asparagine synthetase B (glutamine-hydrolysing)